MFNYHRTQLLESFLQYPNYYLISPPKTMQFIVMNALPLLDEQEKKAMDLLKQEFDRLLNILLVSSKEQKETTAQLCVQLLYDAISLYDQAFDRVANNYFVNICN